MTRALRILQVDDESDDLFLFSHAVRTTALPIEVFPAAGGREALNQLSVVNPDLVLLDLNMPSMSGFDVLADLKRIGRQPPILIFTSSSELVDIARARHLGADGYYVKPNGLAELVQLVAMLYDRWLNDDPRLFKWP